MNKQYLDVGKQCIKNDDKTGLKTLIESISYHNEINEYIVNYQYIFLQLLNHSALLQKKWSLEYMIYLYNKLSKIDKIALRQALVYPKYIMRDQELIKWYSDIQKKIFTETRI